MTSYRNRVTINQEEEKAAKEKKRRLLLDILSRLEEYFYPLAAKFNKKLLQGVQGDGFLEKSPPGGRRQKNGS